jgi:hypothetical protein
VMAYSCGGFRSVAAGLRRIGDQEPAQMLDAAADPAGAVDRAAALEVARQAIARNRLSTLSVTLSDVDLQ